MVWQLSFKKKLPNSFASAFSPQTCVHMHARTWTHTHTHSNTLIFWSPPGHPIPFKIKNNFKNWIFFPSVTFSFLTFNLASWCILPSRNAYLDKVPFVCPIPNRTAQPGLPKLSFLLISWLGWIDLGQFFFLFKGKLGGRWALMLE